MLIAQTNKEQKAQKKFDDYQYQEAIESYKEMVQNGYTSQEAFQNLGNANYVNANYKDAANYYGKLMEMELENLDPDYLYKYAQCLKSIGQYEASNQWMESFVKRSKMDNRASKYTANRAYLSKIEAISNRYNIALADINSSRSDFAPSFYGEKLIFSSARDTGLVTRNIHDWNKQPFLNLYSADITETDSVSNITRFSNTLNGKTHESSTVFTKDGNTVYFTRNNSENGKKFNRDEEGVSRLKILRASLVNGDWTNVVELPFNSDEYSNAHPTLSPEEDKMYFASERPGSFGASDIYMVTIDQNGNFGEPVNLGPEINTEARETFPFMASDGTLYFASDGHQGLGGLDVYAAHFKTGLPAQIVNLGKPINSEVDDFSFIINGQTKKGFFASNRLNGVGSDDIYGFEQLEPIPFDCPLKGIVLNATDRSIIADAHIEVYGDDGKILAKTVSKNDGTFSLLFDCGRQKIDAVAMKPDFKDGKVSFDMATSTTEQVVEMLLEPEIKAAEEGTDLAKLLNLNPIYFDLNKSYIRPDAELELKKVLDYMNQFQAIKISIRSHTDSRGSDAYNYSLSDRRAKSTRQYLISKGIAASRLQAKGYGETKLVNRCANGVKCSNQEHDVNRRSEFIVVK